MAVWLLKNVRSIVYKAITAGRKGSGKTSVLVKSEYHTLTEPVYLGEKEGKVAAEAYVYYDAEVRVDRIENL